MLKEIAIASLDNEEMYNNHFDLHSISLRNKETKLYTVIQELKHFQSLDELKRVPGVLNTLQQNITRRRSHICEESIGKIHRDEDNRSNGSMGRSYFHFKTHDSYSSFHLSTAKTTS
jgi:hypothetical protein